MTDSSALSLAPEQTLRGLYAALARRQPQEIASLLHPDVVFHVPGRGPNAGDHRGRGEVLALFERSLESTAGSLRLELRDVAAGAEHVLALARLTASGALGQLDHRLCHVVKVRAGQVTESWYFSEDQYAADAFWSQKGAA